MIIRRPDIPLWNTKKKKNRNIIKLYRMYGLDTRYLKSCAYLSYRSNNVHFRLCVLSHHWRCALTKLVCACCSWKWAFSIHILLYSVSMSVSVVVTLFLLELSQWGCVCLLFISTSVTITLPLNSKFQIS